MQCQCAIKINTTYAHLSIKALFDAEMNCIKIIANSGLLNNRDVNDAMAHVFYR